MKSDAEPIRTDEPDGADREPVFSPRGWTCPGCGNLLGAALPEGILSLRCRCGMELDVPLSADAASEKETVAGARPETLLVIQAGPSPADTLVDEARASAAAGREDKVKEDSGEEKADSSAADEEEEKSRQANRIGNYEIIGEIARGGMGVVYRARQVGLKREVALKMLLAGEGAGEEQIKRFLREAESAAGLSHPNIVPIYDVGEDQGRHYYAMEFIQGESVADVLDRMTPLPPRQSMKIAREVATALVFAHEGGIVHRDIKPANIMLAPVRESSQTHVNPDAEGVLFSSGTSRTYRVVVTDFGLAKDLSSGSLLTVSGAALGTPVYMPPEQADGDLEKMGPRSDVYSLGAVLYEMITGKEPFQGSSLGQILTKVIMEDPIPPRRHLPGLHRDVETIILTAMAKDPERRYASAEAMGEDIDRFLRGEPILARPAGLVYRAGKKIRRHKALSVAIILILAAGIGAVIYTRVDAAARAEETRDKARGLMVKARSLLETKKYLEAQKTFEAASALVPDLSEAGEGAAEARILRLADRSATLIDQGKYEAAGYVLEEAESQDPSRPELKALRRLQKGTATIEADGPRGEKAFFIRAPADVLWTRDLLDTTARAKSLRILRPLGSLPLAPVDRPFGDGFLVTARGDRIEGVHFLPVPRSKAIRVRLAVIRVDAGGGGDVRTIREALEKARPGTVVEVGAGTYSERLVISVPSVTLRTAPDAKVELRTKKGPLVKAVKSPGLRIQGLHLHADTGHVICVESSACTAVVGNAVTGGTQEAVWLRSSPASLVAQNEVHGCKEAGIKLKTCNHGAVVNNHVHHVGWAGIVVEGIETHIAKNRIHHNTRAGIFMNNSTRCEIYENLIFENIQWGILVAEKTKDISVRHNLVTRTRNPDTRKFGDGITFHKSYRGEIAHNTVWANLYGVRISGSLETDCRDNLIVGNRGGIRWHEGGPMDFNCLWDNPVLGVIMEKKVETLEALRKVFAWKGARMEHGMVA